MKMRYFRVGNTFPQRGIYRLAGKLSSLPDELKQRIAMRIVCLGSLQNRAEMFREFAESWKFPEYFGENWDAFEEVVRELPSNEVYVVQGTASFRRLLPQEWLLLENILYESLSPRALVFIVSR